jgi:ABC-type xylose transport system permease subunit
MQRVTQRLGIVPTLLLGAGLVALGLLALNHIVNTMWPFDVSRLELVRATAQQRVDAAMLLAAADNDVIIAFLASIICVVTGLALPIVYFLNRRFHPNYRVDQPPFLMIIRQALWAGLWVAFCVWLQMNRTLGIAVAVLVAAVFILFELLLQIRTRASAVQQQVPQQQ